MSNEWDLPEDEWDVPEGGHWRPVEVTLGQRFPQLALLSDLRLDHPDLGIHLSLSRAQLLPATAARHGCFTVGDLLSLTENGLFDWTNVGVTKVKRFLDALTALDQLAPQLAADLTRASASEDGVPPELARIAEWAIFAAGAKSWGDVAAAFDEEGLPPDVGRAWENLAARPLNLSPAPQPLEVLARWIDELPERERGVLEGRIVRLSERTLQGIADDYGVTRERIRQIQVRLENDLNDRLSDEGWRAVGWAVHSLRNGLGAMAPLDEVAELSPEAPMAREFRVLLWFAGYDWDLAGGTLRRRGFALPRIAELETHEDGLRINREKADALLCERGVLERHMDFVLDHIKGVHRFDDGLVRWPGNIADRGAAILALAGRPLTVDEVADAVPGEFNRRGFRDRVFNHPKVMRTGKNEIGLRCWGLEEYSGVVNAMVRILEEEGSTPLAELQTRLAGQFNISPASVSMYAGAPIFHLERGRLQLRGAREPYQPRNRPWTVPGLYFSTRGVVIWHVDVDHDMLRGSGRSIPNELALACGATLNASVDFISPSGVVQIRWPDTSHVGAAIGSLRALAESVSAAQGDRLRLVFDTRRHLLTAETPRPVPDLEIATDSVESLTGLYAEDCESLERLADAIGTTPAEVLTNLRDRGDSEVADAAQVLPRSRT